MAKVDPRNILMNVFLMLMGAYMVHFFILDYYDSKSTDLEQQEYITMQRATFFDWQDCNDRAQGDALEEMACANEFYPVFKATREELFKPR